MGNKTFDNLDSKKQNRIFRAAVREFSQKGYALASINVIVSALGIAKGSIFQYFGDKQGLFNFVFSKAVAMVKNYLRKVREDTRNEDFFSRLEKLLVSGVAFVRKHPGIYALYTKLQFEEGAVFCNELLASLRRESLEFLSELISQGIESGDLNPNLDIPRTAFILDALLERFLHAYMLEHIDAGQGLLRADETEIGEWARAVVALLRQGLVLEETGK